MLPIYILFLICEVSNGMQVLMIGDFGDSSSSGIQRQEELSVIMSEWCGMRKCEFIVSSGDNFYMDGVTSVDDPRFNTSWRWVYDKPNIDSLTWYMSLGNHDYGIIDNRELYQVEFGTLEPRWYLPWLWYDFEKTTDDGATVHFIVVDAMSILVRKHDWEAQLEWYNTTLSESTADWKIVVEHYPPYTVGGYGPGSQIHRQALVPAAEAFGVDLFVAGHDHNLQHLAKRTDPDVDYIVTAGGGRGLYVFETRANNTLSNQGFESKYFGYTNGFVMLDINAERIIADFVDLVGDVKYSFTRQK